MPLSLKYSPMAQPEYGARYCSGAASDAVALTMIVYFIASVKDGRKQFVLCLGFRFASFIISQ